MSKSIDRRLSALEAGASPKGCAEFSELWVRPAGQTEKERAEFDAAVQQARREGRALSVYGSADDPDYIQDIGRFLE